jgi:hypothetical protein
MGTTAVKIEVSRRRSIQRMLYFCLGTEIFIVLADIFLNYLQWIPFRPLRRVFNITREDAIGNWFSSTQTLFVGLVLWILFSVKRREKNKWGWAVLACFFTFMAIDDASKLHERAGSSLKALAPSIYGAKVLVEHYPSYAWQILFGPFLTVMGLYIVWFVWKELNITPYRLWIVSAVACLGLAVCLDALEGMDLPSLSSYSVAAHRAIQRCAWREQRISSMMGAEREEWHRVFEHPAHIVDLSGGDQLRSLQHLFGSKAVSRS